MKTIEKANLMGEISVGNLSTDRTDYHDLRIRLNYLNFDDPQSKGVRPSSPLSDYEKDFLRETALPIFKRKFMKSCTSLQKQGLFQKYQTNEIIQDATIVFETILNKFDFNASKIKTKNRLRKKEQRLPYLLDLTKVFWKYLSRHLKNLIDEKVSREEMSDTQQHQYFKEDDNIDDSFADMFPQIAQYKQFLLNNANNLNAVKAFIELKTTLKTYPHYVREVFVWKYSYNLNKESDLARQELLRIITINKLEAVEFALNLIDDCEYELVEEGVINEINNDQYFTFFNETLKHIKEKEDQALQKVIEKTNKTILEFVYTLSKDKRTPLYNLVEEYLKTSQIPHDADPKHYILAQGIINEFYMQARIPSEKVPRIE